MCFNVFCFCLCDFNMFFRYAVTSLSLRICYVYRVIRSAYRCSIFSVVCFCRSLFVLLYFSVGHWVVYSSSLYGFWLPHWYLQALFEEGRALQYKKTTKGPTTICKTLHQKIKIQQHGPHQCWTQALRKRSCSCSTIGTRHVSSCFTQGDKH
jgi:hypothetical protein